MDRLANAYVLLDREESSTFGHTQLANRVADDAVVVITSVDQHLVAEPAVRQRLAARRTVLLGISDPYLLPVREVILDGEDVAIVHEAPGGPSLRARLTASGPLPPYEAADVVGAVLRGVLRLHELGLTHGDLRPETVHACGPEAEDVRLSDYGLAEVLRPRRRAGAAPEVAAGGPPSPSSDVFDAGTLLFELVTGARPNDLDMYPPDAAKWGDAGLLEFAERMRSDDPEARPTVRHCIDRLAFLGNQAPDPTMELLVPTALRERWEAQLRTAQVAKAFGVEVAPEDIPMGVPPEVDEHAGGNGNGNGAMRTARRHGIPAAPPAVVEPQGEGQGEGPGLTDARDLAAPIELGPSAATRRSGTSLARIGLAVAAVLALVAGGWALTNRSGSTPEGPFQPASFAFDAQLFRSTGLVVTRSYTIENRAADKVRVDLRLSNTGAAPLTSTWDEVVPKSVSASSRKLRFLPLPDAVIKEDPVVRFSVDGLATGHARKFLYDSDLPDGTPNLADRLAILGNDQRDAQKAWFVANGLTEQPIGLGRIELGPGEQTRELGLRKAHQVVIIGHLADEADTIAPPAMLQNLTWLSDHPDVVSVDSEGQLLGHKLGTAEIVVSNAAVSARMTVTVTPDGPGDAPGSTQDRVVIDDPSSTTTIPGATTTAPLGPTTTLDPAMTGGTLPPSALPTPTTLAPTTVPATEAPRTTRGSAGLPPGTPPVTPPPGTNPPPTNPPATNPPPTNPPPTNPPPTNPTTTLPPPTEPPTTEPPTTEPPTTEPPVTEPPTTEPQTTQPTAPPFTLFP